MLTEVNWRELVREHLRLLDWNAILVDVRPFVEPGFNLGLLTLANLERILGEYSAISACRTTFLISDMVLTYCLEHDGNPKSIALIYHLC